jgi:hypothetical protein
MATTEFQITEANIGEMIGPPDGFIVALSMTTPPIYETPCWNEGTQKWLSGDFVLRGSNDFRDFVCIQPHNNGGAFAWYGPNGQMLVNRSESYSGGLMVVAVPKGSVWALTLSDVPNVRVTDAAIGVSNRMAALESHMQRRQLGEAKRA